MTREQIGEKLRDVMQASSQADVDWGNVTEESAIVDLGFDSLSILDLIYDIQQAFEMDFDAEELTGVASVADLVTFIESRQ
jgi:acyl carrier protein